MEYLINKNVRYNSLDGTLFNHELSVNMITLARISNELLLLFIQNAKRLLSREEILNELWEKRGLSASSNNLNNHMSILRKALAECGCAGVITTVPKQGFLFDAEISVMAPISNALAVISSNIDDTVPTLETQVSLSKVTKRKLVSRLTIKIVSCVFLIAFAALAYNFYDYLVVTQI